MFVDEIKKDHYGHGFGYVDTLYILLLSSRCQLMPTPFLINV